jgi:hypothetical protein
MSFQGLAAQEALVESRDCSMLRFEVLPLFVRSAEEGQVCLRIDVNEQNTLGVVLRKGATDMVGGGRFPDAPFIVDK